MFSFLTLAALFWSGNFIIGKFVTLFEVPPLTLNFLRWVMVWFILIPFTFREIIAKRNYIKENFLVISVMGILTISTFNSVVYFALNFTQVINAVLMLAAIPPMIIIFSSIMKIEKNKYIANLRINFIHIWSRNNYFKCRHSKNNFFKF